jgi:hypothetical protein
MSNSLEVIAGSAPTVAIRAYVADGIGPSGDPRALTFSGDAPPTDGSIALCFVTLAIAGLSYASGEGQRLLYFSNGGNPHAKVNGGSGFNYVAVPYWSYVAGSNDPNT